MTASQPHSKEATMSTETKPYKVYDGGATWQPTMPERARILAWARSEGLNPDNILRMEVYDGDKPYGRVTVNALDEDGRLRCHVDHDHRADGDRCIWPTRTYDHPLSTLPPEEKP